MKRPLLSFPAALLLALAAPALAQERLAFVGARLWDGTGAPPVEGAALLIENGRVVGVGRMSVPDGFRRIDLEGRHLIPGLVNAHGHVGAARGLEAGPGVYTRALLIDQLARSARYGVTTVVSLGGDGPEGVALREEEGPELARARLRVAGPVLDPDTREEARAQVSAAAELGADWLKIRVEPSSDGGGMSPEVYAAVAAEGEARGLPLAVHIIALEDAKGVLRAGADLLAHSVRDLPIDDELVTLMKQRDVCLVPTLMREVSVFAYAERPEFFDDPFFTSEVEPAVLAALSDPARMARIRASENAKWAREQALPQALRNLKRLSDAGAGIAMGTDSGQPGRFPGYFEHRELELMADAGLLPERVLRAATGEAARCVGLEGVVGTLEPGAWADFVVLRTDPLVDVRNTRSIEAVYVAGNRVPGR